MSRLEEYYNSIMPKKTGSSYQSKESGGALDDYFSSLMQGDVDAAKAEYEQERKRRATDMAMSKLMAGGSTPKSPYAGMRGEELYMTRKQEEQQAKGDFWSSIWSYLGHSVAASQAAPTQQAELAQKAADSLQGMKAAKEVQEEVGKVIDWDGREDLVKEYKRLRRQALFDPAGVDSARMQEVHEQLVAGDTAAGNGERSYGALDRFGNITTGAAENIGSAAVNTWSNINQLAEQNERSRLRSPEHAWLEHRVLGVDEDHDTAHAFEQYLDSEEHAERYAKIDTAADQLSDAAAQDLQTAKEGLGFIGQAGVDIAENVLEMGFDVGVGYLTGGGSLASMFARVYGQSVGEARRAGADVNEQALFGLAKGAIEVATEKMFDFGGIYGGGWLDDATSDVVRRLTGNKAGRALLLTLASASQEGLEEVVSDLLAPLAEKIYNDEAMQNGYFSELDFKDMLYSYLIGMAIGSFGAVTKAANGGFSETLDQMDMRDAGIGSVDNQTGAAMDVLSGRVSTEEQEARRERAQDRLSARGYDEQGNRASVQIRIADNLEQRGLDKETAQQVAELSVKQATGQELTTQEQATLEREQTRLSLLEQEENVDRNLELSKDQEEILLEGYENERSVHNDLSRQMYAAAMKEAYAAGKRGLTLSQALRNSAFADTVLADNYRHAFEMGAGKATSTGSAIDVKNEEGRQQLTASLAMLGTHAQAAAEVYEAEQDADAYAAAMEFAANYAANGGSAAELVQQAKDGTVKGTNLSILTDAQVAAAQQIGAQMRQTKTQQTKELAAKRKAVSEQAETILAESNKDFAELGEAIRDATAYVRQAKVAYNGALQELAAMTEADPNAESTEAYQKLLQKANDMLDDIRETEKLAEQLKSARKEAKAKTQRKKGHVSYDGGRAGRENYAAVDRSKLSKEQTRVVDMVEALADIINVDFVIGRTRSTVGGTYVKGGVVYININAEINVRKFCSEIAAAALSHELTHFAQDYAPEEYAELRDFVVKTVMQKSPAQFDALVKQQLRWEPQLSYDAAVDELVANGCMTMLKNTNAVRALVREHLTLAERFQNRIEEISEKIKAGFAGVDVNENALLYYTARILQEQFGEIQTRWDKAVAAATRNYNAQKTVERATGAKENTAPEGGVQNMAWDAGEARLFNPEGKSRGELLQDILDGAQSFDGRYLYFGRFTQGFRDFLSDNGIAAKDLPVVMNYRDAYLSMETKENGRYKGDGVNYHGIGVNGMNEAMDHLSSPSEVMASNKPGKVELALDFTDSKGRRGLAIVELNTVARNASQYLEAHVVNSIYGKRNIDRYIEKARSEGRLLQKEREDLSTVNSQVQYEGIDIERSSYEEASASNNSITDSSGNSNTQNSQSQRWDNADDDTAREALGREISYARLQAENAALHDAVEGLKKINGRYENTLGRLARSLSLTKTNAVRIEDAQKLARQLLKEYGSRGDYVSVQKQLKELGDYILQTPAAELGEEEVKRRARAIASEIIDNAVTIADFGGERQTAQEIAGKIKGKKLSIDRAFLGELDVADGFNAFRKANFGNFTLAQRETNSRETRADYETVDQFYIDLQGEYGEGYFPNVANEGEQIRVIADMFQRAQGVEVNPFTQYEGEAAEYLANKIAFDAMEGVMKAPDETEATTAADRVRKRMDAVREAVAEQVRNGSITKARGEQIIEIAERPLAELEQATSIYQKVNKYAEARMAQVQAEGKARAAEIKAKERAKANEKIAALKEHYQDMARRARQGRQNTASRGKIRKLINELNAKLAKPSENRYIPRELVQVTIDVLEMIDTTPAEYPAHKKKADGTLTATIRVKGETHTVQADTLTELHEKIDELRESDPAAERRKQRLAEKLADIRTMYEGYQNDEKYAVVYDEVTAETLKNLEAEIRSTKLADMTDVQLDAVYQTLKSLNHVISTSVNVQIGNEERSAYELSKEMTAETRDIPKAQTSWLKNKWLVSHLRADVMFARFGGFKKNSAWSQVGRMLNDGQLKQTQIKMELSRPFAELINNRKGLEDFTGTNYFGRVQQDKLVDIGLKDAEGNAIPVTHGLMVSIYMDLLNEDARRHFIEGGKTIPELQQYYSGKGGWGAGSRQAVGISERLSELESDLAEAKRGLVEDNRVHKDKVAGIVREAIADKGSGKPAKISSVPSRISRMVRKATENSVNLTGKTIALERGYLYHAYKRHSNPEVETSRDQVALTENDIIEAVCAIYDPDVIESLFTTAENPTQQTAFAYAKKTVDGHYIVAEAVGGKNNPNVFPTEIHKFTEHKWKSMIQSGKTIGELLYEHDAKMLGALDVAANKNNRVIAAQFARISSPASSAFSSVKNSIAHISEKSNMEDGHNREQNSVDDIRQQIKALLSEGEQYADSVKQSIEAQLTDFDRKWIAASQQLMDVDSKRLLNETTMEVYGIEKARVDNYWSIFVDPAFLNAPFEDITKNLSLENAGFMKERVKSGKPTLALDAFDVVNRQIDRVSQYCGLMPAIRNFNKIYGKTQTGYTDSLKKELSLKFNDEADKWLGGLIADLTGSGSQERNTLDLNKKLGKLRGNLAQSTLTLNPRVAFSQAASFPTAAAELGWEPLTKAFFRGGRHNHMFSRADQELIAKWSPLLWLRMQGYSTQELGDIKNNNGAAAKVWKKLRWFTGWIQAVDGATVGRLWYASEYWVQDHMPTLEKGTDAYYEAVTKKFNDVVEKTQPNYTPMQRATILRDPNALVRTFTMFMTQRLQNFNILYDSTAAYQKARADCANGKNGVTRADVTEAKKTMVRAGCSQFAQAVTYTLVRLIADALLHNMNGYRDDDTGELTAKSISLQILDNFVNACAGTFIFGSFLYSAFDSLIGRSSWYGLSVNGVDSVNDIIERTLDLAKGDWDLKDEDSRKKLGKKLLREAESLGQIFALPVANANKLRLMFKYHLEDMANGEFLSFNAGFEPTNKQLAMREVVASGLKVKQYKKIVKEADTDKNGKYKQDEIGPYLQEKVRAGELTMEQASAVWDAATTGSTSFSGWLAKQK